MFCTGKCQAALQGCAVIHKALKLHFRQVDFMMSKDSIPSYYELSNTVTK